MFLLCSFHEEMKKWVVNAPSIDLKGSEVQLLRKGLNYALTPDTIPRKDIIASVKQSISGVPAAAIDKIRDEVSHIRKKHAASQNKQHNQRRVVSTERPSEK